MTRYYIFMRDLCVFNRIGDLESRRRLIIGGLLSEDNQLTEEGETFCLKSGITTPQLRAKRAKALAILEEGITHARAAEDVLYEQAMQQHTTEGDLL